MLVSTAAELTMRSLSKSGANFGKFLQLRECSKETRLLANLHILNYVESTNGELDEKRFRLVVLSLPSVESGNAETQARTAVLLRDLSWLWKENLLCESMKRNKAVARYLLRLPLLDFSDDQVAPNRVFFNLLRSSCENGEEDKLDLLIPELRPSSEPDWATFRALLPDSVSFEATLLLPACRSGSRAAIRSLLREGGFRNVVDSLIVAVREGWFGAFETLMEFDIPLTVNGGARKETPLIAACDVSEVQPSVRIAMVRRLAARIDDFHGCDSKGEDAFQKVARFPDAKVSAQMMGELLVASAHNRIQSRIDRALVTALSARHKATVRLLVKHGARIPDESVARVLGQAVKTSEGVEILFEVREISENLDSVVDFRATSGMDGIECVPQTSVSLLHFACLNKFHAAVEKLLDRNANPLASTIDGRTVLEAAFFRALQDDSFTAIFKLLLRSLQKEEAQGFVTGLSSTGFRSPLQSIALQDTSKLRRELFRHVSQDFDLVQHFSTLPLPEQRITLSEHLGRLGRERRLEFLRRAANHLAGEPVPVAALARVREMLRLLCASDLSHADGLTLLQAAVEAEPAPAHEEVIATGFCMAGDPAFSEVLHRCLVRASLRELPSSRWAALQEQLLQRLKTTKAVFESRTLLFEEDADAERDGWTALRLSTKLDVSGINEFSARYGAAYEGSASGRFRIDHDACGLVLKGKWSQRGLGYEGKMHMKIPFGCLCSCKACHEKHRGDGSYSFKRDEYLWTWKPAHEDSQEECTRRVLAHLRTVMECIAEDGDATKQCIRQQDKFQELLEACSAMELWNVVHNLVKASQTAPQGILKRIFDYATHFGSQKDRERLGNFLALDAITAQLHLPLAGPEKHPAFQLGGAATASDGTMLSQAISKYKDRRLMQPILEMVCKARAASDAAWNPQELYEICKMAVTKESLRGIVLSVLKKHGFSALLRMELPSLIAICGDWLELGLHILKSIQLVRESEETGAPDENSEGHMNLVAAIFEHAASKRAPSCRCFSEHESRVVDVDAVTSCGQCGWEVVAGACVDCDWVSKFTVCGKCARAFVDLRQRVLERALELLPASHREESTGSSVLILAINHRCWKTAKALIEQWGWSPESLLGSSDSKWRTPMLLCVLSQTSNGASKEDRDNLVRLLLAAGALDTPDMKGRTALQAAIDCRDVSIISLLLSYPVAIRASLRERSILSKIMRDLHAISKSGRLEPTWISAVLQAGADPIRVLEEVSLSRDQQTMSLLVEWCCSRGLCEAGLAEQLRAVLERGEGGMAKCMIGGSGEGIRSFLVETESSFSKTAALSAAVLAQNVVAVSALVEHDIVKCAINVQDLFGMTALHHACTLKDRSAAIVKLLLLNGASPSMATKEGTAALHLAVGHGNQGAVVELLSCLSASEINMQDSNGTTPLLEACLELASAGTVDFVSLLLPRGCDPNRADNRRVTPLMIACRSCHETAIKRLLEAGADVALEDCHGRNAIRYLASPEKLSLSTLFQLVPTSHFGSVIDSFAPAEAGKIVERLHAETPASMDMNSAFLRAGRKRKLQDAAPKEHGQRKRFRHTCYSVDSPCRSCAQCVADRSGTRNLGNCFNCYSCEASVRQVTFSFKLGSGLKRRRVDAESTDSERVTRAVHAIQQAAHQGLPLQLLSSVCAAMKAERASLRVQSAGMAAIADALPTKTQLRWEDSRILCKQMEEAGVVDLVREAFRGHGSDAALAERGFDILVRLLGGLGSDSQRCLAGLRDAILYRCRFKRAGCKLWR